MLFFDDFSAYFEKAVSETGQKAGNYFYIGVNEILLATRTCMKITLSLF